MKYLLNREKNAFPFTRTNRLILFREITSDKRVKTKSTKLGARCRASKRKRRRCIQYSNHCALEG
jgi:hypothetical protein